MTDNQKQDVPQIGDIWQQLDPRQVPPRYVRVEDTGPRGIVSIVTVVPFYSDWIRKTRAPVTRAALGRFDGKRGGYKLHHRPETSNT